MKRLNEDQRTWLELAKRKPIAFAHGAGFNDMSDLHNSWIRKFLYSKSDYTLQAHRGSYKTTSLSVALALMMILYPSKSIMFIRKTDDDVKEIVSQISKILLTDLFNDLSIVLYGKPVILTKQSAYDLSTNLNATPRGASQLTAIGTGGSITGKHADIIATDDIINRSDRTSKAERDRTKGFYQELQNVKNRGGRIINTGTPWHKDDAFSLMPEAEKFDCYQTGLMSDQEIKDIKGKMTHALFAANYELKHVSEEDMLFTDPTIDDGTNTELIYNGICHLDAAYGGGTGDTNAFTIAKKAHDGKLYVLGLVRQGHVDSHIAEFERMRTIYRAGTLYNETNGDKGYLLRRLQDPKQGYHEKTNKFVKITSYIKPVWDDIVFIQGTDDEYINQIIDYGEQATVDDAPDSLASALRVLTRKRKRQNMATQAQALKDLGL